MTTSKWYPPYPVGTKVRYIGNRDRVWTKLDPIHIIVEIDLDNYSFEGYRYSTNQGAWFSHKDFELISSASQETFEQLIRERNEAFLEEEVSND